MGCRVGEMSDPERAKRPVGVEVEREDYVDTNPHWRRGRGRLAQLVRAWC